MAEDLDPLVYDFVEWVSREPRPYARVMDVWRTSCPRLPIWEDAIDRGLTGRRHVRGDGQFIFATEAGEAFLREYRARSGF